MQLFVGVWPPPKVVAALAAYPRHADVAGWSTAAQWLVKVRPLGHVAPGPLAELVETLRFELDGMPRPTARLQTPLSGEWLRAPVAGLEELRDLVFEVTTPIVPITHPNAKPWEVSIVLSRGRAPKALVHPLAATWRVRDVVVARGTRSKAGHGYETLETIPLGA